MYAVYVLGFRDLKPIGFVEAGRFSSKALAIRFLNKYRQIKPDHADSYTALLSDSGEQIDE